MIVPVAGAIAEPELKVISTAESAVVEKAVPVKVPAVLYEKKTTCSLSAVNAVASGVPVGVSRTETTVASVSEDTSVVVIFLPTSAFRFSEDRAESVAMRAKKPLNTDR